jgi:N-methylhydantoinase A
MPGAQSPLRLDTGATGQQDIKGHRSVYFHDAGGYLKVAVYDRYALAPGARIDGPAIFEENESTFVVGPDSKIEILIDGTILVEMPK